MFDNGSLGEWLFGDIVGGGGCATVALVTTANSISTRIAPATSKIITYSEDAFMVNLKKAGKCTGGKR